MSAQIELLNRPGLLTPSRSYKPFRYPWAIEYWRRQQQIHWLPEEVPLGEDCKDWASRLTDAERNLLLLKGAIPGPEGGLVMVRSAVKTPAAKGGR